MGVATARTDPTVVSLISQWTRSLLRLDLLISHLWAVDRKTTKQGTEILLIDEDINSQRKILQVEFEADLSGDGLGSRLIWESEIAVSLSTGVIVSHLPHG